MDQAIRNKLRNVVTQCRKLLEDAVAQVLQGQFGIYPTGKKDEVHVEDEARMTHLVEDDRACRRDLLDHLDHIQALGYRSKDALAQLVREIAFTHLNRLCAYKMMEARGVVINGRPFREAVSRGLKSQGFLFYLAEHPEDEKRYNSGHQDVAYRHFLDWLGGTLSEEIGVLFSPNDPANRLYPPQRVLDAVLHLINTGDIKPEETELQKAWPTIWSADETIGWVYQYFTPKELRDQARKESAAPRNSYELAFRNQFFTPRYVVEFLTDNTLGRIWYEMRKGQTRLKDQCRYMVRRSNEVFLAEGESLPSPSGRGAGGEEEGLSQEDSLKLPAFIPHRPKKDPREIRILDPACGSGHFLLYCFDLLETVYEEAYDDLDLGPALKKDYPTRDDLRRAVPGLILGHNLHGIDIDLRATQIAALALWLRCQRAYKEQNIRKDRPRITRSNIVCAEPMPGEKQLLEDFLKTLRQDRLETLIQRVMQVPDGTRVRATQSMVDSLCELVRVVWEKMRLAGEAGSLLKIEEELQEAIRVGQEEWEERQPLFRITEFSLTEQPKESYLRFIPGEDVSFWQQAERLVLAALRDFARFAGNGHQLQRRLFADDAGRGFAFVDLCQRKFDTVVMNPPFGEVAVHSRSYLYTAYENASQDVFSAFVDRGINLLMPKGLLGAITSRLAFYLELLESWRARLFVDASTVFAMADLGYGVLDDALVEAAAYVVEKQGSPALPAVFLNMLACGDKAASLLTACSGYQKGHYSSTTHCVATSSFLDVPANRAAYWVSPKWRRLFKAENSIHSAFGFPFVGLQTGDDELFLRLHWEVPAASLQGQSPRWVSFAKGGEYAPFFGDFHLVLDWSIREKARRQSNATAYFRPGVTYTERTTSNLSARILPAGCVFSPNGVTISPTADGVLECTFLLNTRFAQFMLEMCVGSGDAVYSGSAARHYGPRIVARVPVPTLTPEQREIVSADARAIWKDLQRYCATQEPDRYFVSPFSFSALTPSIEQMAEEETSDWESCALRIIEQHHHGEQVLLAALQLDRAAIAELDRECGVHPAAFPERVLIGSELDGLAQALVEPIDGLIDQEVEVSGASRAVTKKTYIADRQVELLAVRFKTHPSMVVAARRKLGILGPGKLRSLVERIVSYSVGVVFGRWDIRRCLGSRAETPAEPLAPIPACAPGMLRGLDDLPTTTVPQDYPLHINSDGILVDDPEHQEDIIRRVREALELIWKNQADSIERQARDILDIGQLRDYFRKPGNGGFWDDHVSRYSKSRRKAPIYWLLQSSKKNYALWLYYHRLDKDILFKALLRYVEPKIRFEENRLQSLRGQKGSGGKATKKRDKEIEKQEGFLSELRDFEDKLRRAANLHLEPDLNDGVVLNIAPLWELVPWREAKNYWEELLEGKYEWSSIGKQLREKGLVK